MHYSHFLLNEKFNVLQNQFNKETTRYSFIKLRPTYVEKMCSAIKHRISNVHDTNLGAMILTAVPYKCWRNTRG